MLEDIAKLMGRLLVDIVLTILIREPGKFLLRTISKNNIEPRNGHAYAVGLIIWFLLAVILFGVYQLYVGSQVNHV